MKKKSIKYILVALVAVLLFVLLFFIYKNVFAGTESSRYKDKENYKLTNDEKNSVKDKINELEGIDNIDIYIDSNIIKIVVKLKEDIDFETLKTKANDTISSFSEENLSYYDVEFFIDYVEQQNQIGYKFKTNSEFSW
ncbi:MAG: hypothetical protein IKL65_02165 [Bacilli bacterium]|nr:hypothetical protein [Bacilli bacterium]